jgi:AmiR/NasT family two-component response regulator
MAQLREPAVEDLLKQIRVLEGRADVDQQIIARLESQAVVDRAKINNLSIALTTARRIGAAVGILMATQKVTEDEAFDVLRRVSNNSQRKVRDIAEDVVMWGTLPDS